MSDQKRILTDKHKGWRRVWDLIASKRDDAADYEYVHTVNDTHVFRKKNDPPTANNWLYAAVKADDFDVVKATAKKVKCIEATGTSRLISGKVYEVISESDTSYVIHDEQEAGGWYKERFEVVDEGQPAATNQPTVQPTVATTQPPPFDWDAYNGIKKR